MRTMKTKVPVCPLPNMAEDNYVTALMVSQTKLNTSAPHSAPVRLAPEGKIICCSYVGNSALA
jgi:hypothetical protein